MTPLQPHLPMSPQDSAADRTAMDAVVVLHTRTLDALAGYEKMVEKAEPEFLPTAKAFQDLHKAQAIEIARLLAQSGRSPDDDGSIMGSVNKAVVTMRAFFDEIDADVMTNIRDGEKHVLQAFENALGQPLDFDTGQVLLGMRNDLVTLLQRTSHIG